MTTKESLRAHALELASRHGFPPEATLRAARDYLDFLSGVENHPKAPEWLLASVASAAKHVARRAPPKKATPKKRAA